MKKSSRIAFRVDDSLLERLEAISRQSLLPVASLLRLSVESFLATAEKEKAVRIPLGGDSPHVSASESSAVALGDGAKAAVVGSSSGRRKASSARRQRGC